MIDKQILKKLTPEVENRCIECYGFSNYLVDCIDGEVYSKRNKRAMSKYQKYGKNGLLLEEHVLLNKKGGRKNTSLARIIAQSYYQDDLKNKIVTHKNGVKSDHRIMNLKVCDNPSSKRSGYSKPILEFYKGKLNRRYDSMREMERQQHTPWRNTFRNNNCDLTIGNYRWVKR